MANGQTKKKIELRKQYYEKKKQRRKRASKRRLPGIIEKTLKKWLGKKKALEVERSAWRLPVKTMKGEQALKLAHQAFWRKTEKGIT